MSLYKKLCAHVTVIMFVLMPLQSFASDAAELSVLLNQMKTMSAAFTQTIYDHSGKNIQKSTGTMALERPGKFRWQVKKPMPQTIIANGNRLWVYDPDLQQVTIRSLTSEAGEAPALLLSHENTDLEKDYIISMASTEKPLRWFSLKPKKPDNMFASVKMGFSGSQLQEMVLEDQLGHGTRVQFAKIKINTTLSSSLFIFKAPAGIDVIDETRKQ